MNDLVYTGNKRKSRNVRMLYNLKRVTCQMMIVQLEEVEVLIFKFIPVQLHANENETNENVPFRAAHIYFRDLE